MLLAVLFSVAWLFGIVWLGVAICATSDRVLGRPEAIYPPDSGLKKRKPLAVWQRILMVPLAILIVPGVILVMIPVLTAIALLALAQRTYFRSRLALFGIPMPSVPEIPLPP
jgi:hypothetical protein